MKENLICPNPATKTKIVMPCANAAFITSPFANACDEPKNK